MVKLFYGYIAKNDRKCWLKVDINLKQYNNITI